MYLPGKKKYSALYPEISRVYAVVIILIFDFITRVIVYQGSTVNENSSLKIHQTIKHSREDVSRSAHSSDRQTGNL
jgi:hypothetical protein